MGRVIDKYHLTKLSGRRRQPARKERERERERERDGGGEDSREREASDGADS